MAVFLVVSVSASNNYAKEQQFRKLLALRQKVQVTIRRNGREKCADVSRLIVGDILSIAAGDQVPADCVLLSSPCNVIVNESALTGELKQIFKFPLTAESGTNKTDPFLKTGTMIETGSGRAVVCAVGQNTEMGRIHVFISEDAHEQSPLQAKLERIADCILDGFTRVS